MRRTLFLTVAAAAVVVTALLLLAWLEPGTLVRRTVDLADSPVVFRVYERGDKIYVSAEESRQFGNGWKTTSYLGDAAEVGRENPAIDDDNGGVVLRVGRTAMRFEPESRSFRRIGQ